MFFFGFGRRSNRCSSCGRSDHRPRRDNRSRRDDRPRHDDDDCGCR